MRYGLGVWPAGKIVGAPLPSASVGFPWGLAPPDPPPCLSSKGAGHQNVRSHNRMLGPSVYPAYLARGRVIKMLGPIPECLVLQYSQVHRSYQNAWSFSIPRFTPSVFPDSQVENPVLRFQNIHFLESVAKSDPPDPPIRSVSSSQYRRIPRGLKLIANFTQKSIFL